MGKLLTGYDFSLLSQQNIFYIQEVNEQEAPNKPSLRLGHKRDAQKI